MTAVEYAASVLRARFPADADRLSRIARKLRVRDVRDIPPGVVDRYYQAWASRIAGGWLAELNYDELELRLELDQRLLVECDAGDAHEREELLRLTLNEVARRGLAASAKTPWRTRAQLREFADRTTREVFALNPRVPDRWRP